MKSIVTSSMVLLASAWSERIEMGSKGLLVEAEDLDGGAVHFRFMADHQESIAKSVGK